jgi:hypothetical protein
MCAAIKRRDESTQPRFGRKIFSALDTEIHRPSTAFHSDVVRPALP